MGLSFSQQISRDITNGYMDAINQLTANVTTVLNSNAAALNTVHIQVCGDPPCGSGPCNVNGVNVTQGNSVSVVLTAESLQQVVNQVKNDLENVTTQYVQSLNSDQQAWLSFAFGINVQDQSTISNFSQKISNLISNNVTTTCSNDIILDNEATLILCGNINQPVNVIQKNDLLAAQSCISKQIVNNIINNTELYNGMQFADQQNYFAPNGPFSFLYYIGVFILFIIIVVTIAGVIRYATRGPKMMPPAPLTPATRITTQGVPQVTRVG